MTRKHLFAAITCSFIMLLWLHSCQVISPENGTSRMVNEEISNKDNPDSEIIKQENDPHITTADSEAPSTKKSEDFSGISEEESIPQPQPVVVPELNVTHDLTIKCIETTAISCAPVSIHSIVCGTSGATPSYSIAPTGSFSADDLGRDYEEPARVDGAAPTTGKGLLSDMAGKLTAGEINDFEKWKMWEDIAENELQAYQDIWKINCDDRYSVFVQTKTGSPITDATVKLINKDGHTIWETKSDNNGRAELWGKFEQSDSKSKIGSIEIFHQEKKHVIEHPKSFRNGVNILKIDAICDIPDAVDIAFTVDATGSMGDEISYLQAELIDVMNKVKDKHKDIELRLGSVFYRDFSDTYVTLDSKLDANLEITREFVSNQYADGGGDGPEAVEEALFASNNLNWSKNARTRLMFLILDAPPHGDDATIKRIQQQTQEAAKRGIRIIPIVASGGGYDMDKSLEYLMRSCALATNGTYVFLTDHSGIGGAHTAPSTDDYKVETLNDLLLRVINQYLYVPECSVEQFVLNQEIKDTSEVITEIIPTQPDSLSQDTSGLQIVEPSEIFTLKCYPNPASQYFMAETSIQVTEMFLSDNNGKIIERIIPNALQTRIEVADLPTGIYHLKAWINDKWASTRIIVTRI